MTTFYASPTGNDSRNGLTPANAKTLTGAENATAPGDTVILLAGSYPITSEKDVSKSGTATAPITWRGNYNGPALFQYTNNVAHTMIWLSAGRAYRVFDQLFLDGANYAITAFGGQGTGGQHHITYSNCTITNTGSSGIALLGADYLTIVNNRISHCGYLASSSWGSGISLNNQNQVALFDAGTGFHHIIAGNIITGTIDTSSHHTDGNGIILDGYSPNALITNNLVYNNGGRGIHLLQCNSTFAPNGIWVVNNTCYKNVLDRTLSSWPDYSEFMQLNTTAAVVYVNNLAYAWTAPWTYAVVGTSGAITWARNGQYGGRGTLGVAQSDFQDVTKIRNHVSDFINPPVIDDFADGQYATAVAADLIGNGLTLR
jgi:parallel beta-helix repeat protein